MSRRVWLPLLVNVGALALVVTAAIFVMRSTSDDPAGDNGNVASDVPAPPGTLPANANANTSANEADPAAGNNDAGTNSPGNGDNGDSGAFALQPLLPPLNGDEHAVVTRCGYFLYHDDQAAEMYQRLVTEFDCRAIASLREVKYRSQEHLDLLERAALELADRPYRNGNALHFPGLVVQPDLRRIVVETHALAAEDGLEFLLCSPRGKSHESLFMLKPTARHLALALHLIGCDPCTGDRRPMVEGDWALWDGDTVRIHAMWMLGRTKIERPIEDLVLTADTGAKLPATGWVFTGAPAAEAGGGLMADSVGPIASLWSSPFAVLTNPWPGARSDSAYRPSDLNPKPGTPVHLTLLPESDAVRYARLDSLQDEWDAFADHREQLLDETGARALADGVSRLDAERLIAQPDPDGGNGDDPEPDDMMRFAFPALVPELTEDEIRAFHRLVGGLSGTAAEQEAAFEALCELDARYETLADETWRGLRADPQRADLLSSAINKLAYQAFEQDGILYWRGIAVDKERGLVVADALIAPFENMPLEFLICGPRGKGHESIFMLAPHARNLEAGFKALGFRDSKQQPTHQGDWRLYDGDTVIIEAAWMIEDIADRPYRLAGPTAYRDQPGITCLRVEQLVIDRETGKPMPPTGFAFTGSYVIGEGEKTAFAADEAGAVVGALTVPQSVLENPWPRAGEEHAYVASRQHIPGTHRPVRLFFHLEPEADRLARLPVLEAAWNEQKTKRPKMAFSPPPGWKKIGARTDFVYVNDDGASLAVMVEGKYTAEKTITPGYREFVFDKTEFDEDFSKFVGPYTPHGANVPGVFEEPWRTLARSWNAQGIDTPFGNTPHGGHPMWRFVWVDKEDHPVFRAVVMTSRFYYHVFAFWPGRTDLDMLELEFLALLDRLELGHPENHISVGEGWVKQRTLEPKHESLLGDWKIDINASVRNDPRNTDKNEGELRELIREAEGKRLHEAVVGIAEDRIDIFQPNQAQVSHTYTVTRIEGDKVSMDLINRQGHLRETTLTVTDDRVEGDVAGRYLVLTKGE